MHVVAEINIKGRNFLACEQDLHWRRKNNQAVPRSTKYEYDTRFFSNEFGSPSPAQYGLHMLVSVGEFEDLNDFLSE